MYREHASVQSLHWQQAAAERLTMARIGQTS